MAKASKSTAKTSTEPVVDTPVTVEASSSEKAPKTKKAKAPKQEVAATPVVATTPDVVASTTSPVVAEQPVAAETPIAETPIAEQSIEFLAKLQQLGVLISSLKTEYRSLEKKWSRELKSSQKQCSRRKRKSGNRAPSGFVKPTRISDELASFLGKDSGTEMARTSVTRDINTYIRTNNLQDKENGRKINPDAKLASLLKLKQSDELTYFNLQRYMSPHFAKTIKAEVAAVVV